MSRKREFTGAVIGGQSFAGIPYFKQKWDWIKPHAEGRVSAMNEMAIHAVCMKSMGLIPESLPSFTGAEFQDFRAIPHSDVVRAHRAIFALTIGGKNVAKYASNRPLFDLVKAAQARTDPMDAAANYSDRLVEIEAADPVLKVIDRLLQYQRSGKPLEVNALVNIIPDIQKELVSSHGRGIEKSQEILQRRGLTEKSLREELLNNGPKSPIVEERIDFALAKGGPSQFCDLPQIILVNSEGTTKQYGNPTRSDVEQIADQVEQSAAAVSGGAGDAVSGGAEGAVSGGAGGAVSGGTEGA